MRVKLISVLRVILSCILSVISSVIISAEAQETWTPARPLFKADTISICIMGDIMMHTKQIETACRPDDSYDFSSYFTHIQNRIKSADIAIANMEFTLGGKPYSGYPAFSAPDSYAEYLAECGFDVFLAANNHIFDKGGAGAERTLKIYRELESTYGIRICGLAESTEMRDRSMPLKILVKGMRIALINFTYGTNLGSEKHWPKTNYMNDTSLINEALRRSEDCDVTIALPHWGTEYILHHSDEQEKEAVRLAENGADIIIGAHPHVPQDFGTVTERQIPVAYSIGNCISNMSATNTQLGLMAQIRLTRKLNGDIEMLPVRFTYIWCSRPGGFTTSYTVIPVKEYLGKRDKWIGEWEYDKMVTTYERVRSIIGIEDN